MLRSKRTFGLPVLVALAAAACGTATAAPVSSVPPASTAEPAARPNDPGDVAFLTGMIGHHAQAIQIARWAPTHGASPALVRLADRIVVGQQDEIVMMQRWLRNHGETVPEPDSSHQMAGMDHSMHMPGMLSAGQLAALDSARGPAFDRLFLTFMIQHHQGALVMVNELFASPGAGEDDTVFRLASDVQADQITEIRRMQQMLEQLPPITD